MLSIFKKMRALLCNDMRRQYELVHGYKFWHKIRHTDDYLRSGETRVQPP